MNEIERWIRLLDEGSDPLHADVTPAVSALGQLGLPAAPAVIDLLDAPNETTRLHAQRALEAILDQHFGFRDGRGFPHGNAEEAVRVVWRANGNYAYDATAESRSEAMNKWREWVARESRR